MDGTMTLTEAHEKAQVGDKLKHLERQLILVRKETFMATVKGMGPKWMDVFHGEGWIIIPAKKGN